MLKQLEGERMRDGTGEYDAQRQRVQQQFGEIAQSYVESPRHRSGRDLKRLVELAECCPEDRALDVATGGGHTALALAPRVAHVVASDLTPRMLEAAEAFIRSQGVENVSFEVAAAEDLRFDEASFDIVSCRIAPHHFADVVAFCREVARVLKPGGRFVLMDSVAAEDDELDHFINDIEWRRDKSHARSYRLSEWQTWIAATGLDVDLVEEFERRHEFQQWTKRSRMAAQERDELEAIILSTPQRVLEHFSVEILDKRVESFADHKFILRARKQA
ncbi:MAG TPA: class I SAM-dependent methyltransferase [Thermomicrobiales bacterium]|nr:class I SAM-dependent methyltransferase [Thermomicrobiales bacterium]